SVTTNTRQIKLNEKPKRVSTTLLSDWVCTNILPSNIIDDCGLTELFDYCIQIGYNHGPILSSVLLPCRKTLRAEIKKNAYAGRNEMKKILIAAAQQR
ncbi:unnamed protein product, partial [Rotaria magnacalcarata]